MLNFDLLYSGQQPFIKVIDGVLEDVNDMFLNLTGFKREELCGQDINKIFKDLFRTIGNVDFEDNEKQAIIFTKAFEVRFVTIKKHIDSNDSIIYIFKEIENSRLDSKLLFIDKLITEDVIGICIFTAPDFRLIKANQTYLNYLPKPFNTRDTVYGKSIKEVFIDFEGSYIEEALRNIIKTNKSLYITEKQGLMLERDNRYWDNTITPICENGEVKYMVSMLQDVTVRVLGREHIRIKNEEIERQNKRFQAIIECIDDIVTIFDKDGNYLKKNSVLENVFGKSYENFYEIAEIAQFYDFNGNLLPVDEFCTARLLKGEKVLNQKCKMFNGEDEIYVSYSGVPIFDEHGDLEMGVMIAYDITEIIKSSKEIEKALAMKDEFLSLISHEFRTPLNVINTAIQAIEHICGHELSDKTKKYLGMIRQNSFRQLRLVNNLLDITRINAGSIKINKRNIDIVFLTKAITESVQVYAFQKGVELKFISSLL